MVSNPTVTLTALLRSSTIEDHEEVLKTSQAVLKSSKDNYDALYTQVVALLKLDRYSAALKALDKGGDKLAEQCVLEKAYALYRIGEYEDADKVLKAGGLRSRGMKHVAAQLAYRAEYFEDAARMYKELAAHNDGFEGEENDLRINSLAVDAQLEWQGNGHLVVKSRKKPSRGNLESFEMAYNAACGSIARGDMRQGAVFLKVARDLCEALDELPEEEKKAEVLPIMVQQEYILTRLGKIDEAKNLAKAIPIAEVEEVQTRVIAQSNALAASAEYNPYLAKRLLDSTPKTNKTQQHFKNQADTLKKNEIALDLQSMKYSGVARSTSKALSKVALPTISPSTNNLSVLNAAAHAQGQTSKTSLKLILPLLEKRPNDVGLILTIIQLYVLANNPGSATDLLESFFKRLETLATQTSFDVRFAPGLVALIVSLYQSQGRKGPMKTELDKAASYWRKKDKPSESLLRAAGISLLTSGNDEDLETAGKIFDSLRNEDPNNRTAIAGFVASYATVDISKVTQDLEKLTPIEKLTSGIDAEALEEEGIATLDASPSITATASKKRPLAADRKSAPPKKRVRKSRLPKDYDPNKIVDPERWLPIRDRSSYRPKGKKGKKKAVDSTQGGVVKEEESLELVGGAGNVKVTAVGGGGGGKKKSKGKGKK